MMKSGSGCLVALMVAVSPYSSATWSTPAHADGGTLRAWKQHGDYEIAVFTEPTPFVTGPVDISVLLLDRNTGGPIREARVVVEVSPQGRTARAARHAATTQAATNKLLRAAVFELRDSGRCDVSVSIQGPHDDARICFEVDVGRPWPALTGAWPWALWPLPVIVVYGIHRRLVVGGVKRCRPARRKP